MVIGWAFRFEAPNDAASGCLAFPRGRRWGGPARGLEHGVDELDHRALVGGRELLDAAQPVQGLRRLR